MQGFRPWIGTALAIATTMASAQDREQLPTVYEAGHFYVTPTLANGHALRLVADTAGAGGAGRFVLDRSSAKRLGIAIDACKDGEESDDVGKPTYRRGKGIPMNAGLPCDAPALVYDLAKADREDGQLGTGYWAGHVWTFDYPAQTLWLEPSSWHPAPGMHRLALGFPRDAHGKTVGGFARIFIRVAGETLPMLLDTGATGHPTVAGRIAYDEVTATGIGVTSYLTHAQLERWHAAHPQWRVIADGDDLRGNSRLIEVPRVVVGDWSVGPVWFTERPDAAFGDKDGGMASYTDGPVSGALGANVYRHFRMTIDYPEGNAYLACVTGCHAVTDKAH